MAKYCITSFYLTPAGYPALKVTYKYPHFPKRADCEHYIMLMEGHMDGKEPNGFIYDRSECNCVGDDDGKTA